MNDSGARSLELQAQVRHNAEQYTNTITDLYSWEKDIKDKDKELIKRALYEDKADHLKSLPVRSHLKHLKAVNGTENEGEEDNDQNLSKFENEINSPVVEKIDLNLQLHKEANAFKEAGNRFVQQRDYQNALAEYTKAIDIYPNDPIYFNNRALCYLKLEMYEDGINDCNSAIDLDNLSVKAYYRRMQANESLGNHLDALKDCTTALTIDPNNVEAKRSLERINYRLKKNVKVDIGPCFSIERSDLMSVTPITKPAYKRSSACFKRIKVTEIVTRGANPADNLRISDEDIERLFNSNCGEFVEVKKTTSDSSTEISVNEQSNQNVETNHEQNSTAKEEPDKIYTQTFYKEGSTELSHRQQNVQTNALKELPPPVTSTAQFYAHWKGLNADQKYLFLKSINLANISKILGAGFDSATLTDILDIIHDFYIPNEEPLTLQTLYEISKNSQVNILSLLMSPYDQLILNKILDCFDSYSDCTALVNIIKDNFNQN